MYDDDHAARAPGEGRDRDAAMRADHGPSDPPAACHLCATVPDDELAVLTWTLESAGDAWSWICPTCSRDHVRAIEARLGAEWW